MGGSSSCHRPCVPVGVVGGRVSDNDWAFMALCRLPRKMAVPVGRQGRDRAPSFLGKRADDRRFNDEMLHCFWLTGCCAGLREVASKKRGRFICRGEISSSRTRPTRLSPATTKSKRVLSWDGHASDAFNTRLTERCIKPSLRAFQILPLTSTVPQLVFLTRQLCPHRVKLHAITHTPQIPVAATVEDQRVVRTAANHDGSNFPILPKTHRHRQLITHPDSNSGSFAAGGILRGAGAACSTGPAPAGARVFQSESHIQRSPLRSSRQTRASRGHFLHCISAKWNSELLRSHQQLQMRRRCLW